MSCCVQWNPLYGLKEFNFQQDSGWSGGAKVLGKISVPGNPTYLD